MKIASLAPSNTEILCSLGAEDSVVSTTSLCDHPPEAVKKPSTGGWTNTDIEKVLEQEPDLALASDELQDHIVDQLRQEGVEVRQFNPNTVEEVFQSIERIADLVGKTGRADKIVSEMKDEIDELELDGARIYCEEWMEPPMVSGNWIPGLIERAGGNYFIQRGERSRKFDLKKLKEFDPEFIFLNICGAGENVNPSEVGSRKTWQEITAVENGEIHAVDDALLNRPGPRLVEGLKKIEEKVKMRT